jgi:aminomethyltransferase
MSDLKKTALNAVHRALGAKMVEFGGWDMPVQYTSILEEHAAVRTAAGLFDVSHMGTYDVTGYEAYNWLQSLVPNDLMRITPGRGQYTQLCNAQGGVIDDLIVFCLSATHYRLIVNAGNRDTDWQWLQSHLPEGVTLTDKSPETCIFARQGPAALQLLGTLTRTPLESVPAFGIETLEIGDLSFLASRSGYTGEDGFELYVPTSSAEQIWNLLLEAGAPFGLKPVGLGARDTLRLESAMPLHGHEITPEITPVEAGLSWSIRLEKGADFIGREVLTRQAETGVTRKRVGFRLLDTKRAPRQGYPIMHAGQQIGVVTSGSLSPTLGYPIGLGLIDAPWFNTLSTFDIDVRGQLLPAETVKLPFYRRKK